MFDYQEISEYQIEITSYCNAACPQCPRNYNGQGINQYMPLTHLDRSVIDRAFTTELCGRPTWTGNGINLQQISNFINYSLTTLPNTCIEEITFYCNLSYNA